MEPGDTSGMALWDPVSRNWSRAVMDAIDPNLRLKLPPVEPSDRTIGTVASHLTERFELSPQCALDAGSGDNIHNPFYQPGETIYVYFASKLDKWPKNMATERLAKMGVVVQDAPNGKTHYIVVPNSWAAPKEAASTSRRLVFAFSAEIIRFFS